MVALSILLAITGGVLMSIQSPTNAELSKYVGNCQAACMSFGGGLLILLIASIIDGGGSIEMLTHAQPWMLCGGFYGATLVLVVTFAAPALGIALTLTLMMLGQLVMGTIVDWLGLFHTAVITITPLRIAGCLITTVGIILVYVGKKQQGGSKSSQKSAAVLLSIISFGAGCLGSIQTPSNAALADLVGTIESSCMNFVVGTAALLIVTLIINKGKLNKITGVGVKPWMLLGGLYGSCAVFFNIVIVPYIGVVLITVGTMLGQLVGALVIDSKGLLRSPKIKLNLWRIIGVIIIGVGVTLVSIAKMNV